MRLVKLPREGAGEREMVVVLEQAFAYASRTVAPDPINLWAESIRKPPYPTNSGWLNFVLGDGTCAEYLHPGGSPVFSTAHAVLELRSNPEETRPKLVLKNGQAWLIYSSSKLPLDKDLSLASHKGFKGVIRIALLSTEGKNLFHGKVTKEEVKGLTLRKMRRNGVPVHSASGSCGGDGWYEVTGKSLQ
ncbi:hypothetical protein R1sor_003111 [Riccia sorocarpa]|uniref:Uncharacterized protein n=1 Tax=Riccia sorocarpa TaxID=122646 RepID=A0ABD3H4J7_9MARC